MCLTAPPGVFVQAAHPVRQTYPVMPIGLVKPLPPAPLQRAPAVRPAEEKNLAPPSLAAEGCAAAEAKGESQGAEACEDAALARAARRRMRQRLRKKEGRARAKEEAKLLPMEGSSPASLKSCSDRDNSPSIPSTRFSSFDMSMTKTLSHKSSWCDVSDEDEAPLVDLPLRVSAWEVPEPAKAMPNLTLETIYVDSVSAMPQGSAMKKLVPVCAHNEVEPIFESPEVLVTDVLVAKPGQGKGAKSREATPLAGATAEEELPVVNTFIHFASPKAEGSRVRSLSA